MGAHEVELEDEEEVLSVEDLAERQDGVVSLHHARRNGLSPGQIGRRRATGRYRRCRRGVVQLAGVPPSWRQAVRIASIAAGQIAVVSHGSAVHLYGLEMPRSMHPRWRRDDAFIELSAPIPRHVRLEGVRGHRSGLWDEPDVKQRANMAVTSPVRTVIDLSSRLGVEGTGRLLDDMLRRKLLTIAQLRERIAELRPAPGRSMRVLRAVVAARDDTYDPGESTLEARIRRVIRGRKFPEPVGQHWVRDDSFAVRLDFAYPDVKVYLEGDGSASTATHRIWTATSASATGCSSAGGWGRTSRGGCQPQRSNAPLRRSTTGRPDNGDGPGDRCRDLAFACPSAAGQDRRTNATAQRY